MLPVKLNKEEKKRYKKLIDSLTPKRPIGLNKKFLKNKEK